MVEIRAYLLRVTAAAIIVSLVVALVRNNAGQPVIRLIGGMFLCAVVLRPLSHGLPEISLNLTSAPWHSSADYAAEGSRAAQNEMADIITEELEAYILDKAASLNVTVEVEVLLSDDLLPTAAYVTGIVPDSAQIELEQFIEKELGILKENQQWTG